MFRHVVTWALTISNYECHIHIAYIGFVLVSHSDWMDFRICIREYPPLLGIYAPHLVISDDNPLQAVLRKVRWLTVGILDPALPLRCPCGLDHGCVGSECEHVGGLANAAGLCPACGGHRFTRSSARCLIVGRVLPDETQLDNCMRPSLGLWLHLR